MTSNLQSGTDFVLLPGLWLPSAAWDEVVAHLVDLGHRPVVPSLPGVDDADPGATLDDQLAAVLTAVDGLERPVVVGHSAACTLAWLVADRRPGSVRRVVLVGGFPGPDQSRYADFFLISDGVMPFPGWEPFEGADARDLDATARAAITRAAVPVPEGVARGMVRLTDDRRLTVPVTLVCPEFTPDQARAWITAGDVPELARVAELSYVDIDSGHWPMITAPREFARLLHRVVSET